MRIAATLPAVARGSVTFSDAVGHEGAPLIRWHLEPLTAGGQTRAEFVLGPRDVEGDLGEWDAELKTARPDASRWIHAVDDRGVLDVFHEAPAAQHMYRWLWNDLKSIGWVHGLAPHSWPYGVVPPLA